MRPPAPIQDLEFLENLGVEIIPRAVLADYTTFRLGGPCDCLISCQRPDQLKNVVERLSQRSIDFFLMGGGSNLVVSDQGIEKIVIRYLSPTPVITRGGNDVIVSGSTPLDDLVLFALQCGLAGLNYASGIPGTLGGAIVGNAGAFGEQVGDYIKSASLIDRQGKVKDVGPESLGFRYRDSLLKESGEIVLSARFSLKIGRASCRERVCQYV